MRPVSLVLLLVALAAAGCVSADDPAANPSPTPGPAPEDEDVGRTSTSVNATTANRTTSAGSAQAANSSADPNKPSKPENCMRGMSMDGCSAAQADAYFGSQKADAPPPDKILPPVLIALDAQGSNPTGAFTLDEGTMVLLIEYSLNSTGSGPYFALGPDGAGDLTLSLVGPTETKTITIDGRNVGADPARPLAIRSTATVEMPTIGDWSVALEGMGSNVELEVRLVERFYM